MTTQHVLCAGCSSHSERKDTQSLQSNGRGRQESKNYIDKAEVLSPWRACEGETDQRRLTREIDSGADVESSSSPSVVLGPATTIHVSTTCVLLKIGRFLGPTPGLLDQKLRVEHSDLYWKGILMRREG